MDSEPVRRRKVTVACSDLASLHLEAMGMSREMHSTCAHPRAVMLLNAIWWLGKIPADLVSSTAGGKLTLALLSLVASWRHRWSGAVCYPAVQVLGVAVSVQVAQELLVQQPARGVGMA